MRIEVPLPAELEILCQRGISKLILTRACDGAARAGMSVSRYLVEQGFLNEQAVYSALAEACGLPFLPDRSFRPLSVNSGCISLGGAGHGPLLIGMTERDTVYAIAPDYEHFAEVLALVKRRPELLRWVRVTTPAAMRHATGLLNSPEGDLESRYPHYSARERIDHAQMVQGMVLCLGFCIGCFIPLMSGLVACACLIALWCAGVGISRFVSMWTSLGDVRCYSLPQELCTADIRWPSYTVLVPLYREAAAVDGLVEHLLQLDYPTDRLQVLLLLEREDHETHAALKAWRLPSHMSVMRVPAGSPRTKPRALSHGLDQATGALVTVFDAEDRPEVDQLKLAAFFFALAPPSVACFQARLAADNPGDGFLARHFALEYACLFDQLLPWLHRRNWPIPLGGTSNHFRSEALIAVGAWDKFNVTEDADLGIRLVRQGYQCAVLPSTTYEEAPISWAAWRHQRARWHKGWIQTFFVHTRHLGRSYRELGATRLLATLCLIGGNLMVMALSPVFACLLSAYCLGILKVPQLEGIGQGIFVVMCLGSAGLCYAGCALSLLQGARQRRLGLRLSDVLTLPFYWLLNAIAFYQAAWQFLRAPYAWNKTEHGISQRRKAWPQRSL